MSQETKYKINDQTKKAIKASELTNDLKEQLLSREWITSNDLQYVLNKSTTIKSIIPSLEFYFPSKPKAEQSKEFKKQLARLRILSEEQEYQTMISTPETSVDYHTLQIHKDTRLRLDGQDDLTVMSASKFNKQIKEQLTTVINILVTTGSVGFAIWYWTNTSMSNMKTSNKIFLSMLFGLLVLVAEVVVYNGYLRRIDEAKTIEKKKKEKKKILKKIVINKNGIEEEELVDNKDEEKIQDEGKITKEKQD